MSFFEATMLMCFGISWPVSIAKALRTKVVAGKSPLFMAIVCLGYLSGIVHKALYSFDGIIALYAVNFVLVAFDLFLYVLYSRREKIGLPDGA
ncbi:MAG: hypothetical protein JW741_21300 [Sedimentisphaerales bacterium]|nr:hypothetical protein [Sedimentisphaerales bacterium]